MGVPTDNTVTAPSKKGFLSGSAGAIINGLTTIGGWLGIGEGRQDKRQRDQQGALNDINAKTSKELADYENAGKLKMWKDTNYGAQLIEAKKAGVSKAAAIGGSGTGTQGASVGMPSTSGAADAASTTNARTAQQQTGMQLASQMQLMQAQKENIEADTANKKAELPVKGETAKGLEIENSIKGETKEDIIQQAANQTRKLRGEAESAFNSGEIDRETQQQQISKIKEEAIGAGIDNLLRIATKGKTEAETKSINEGVKQKWTEIKQRWTQLDQEQQKIELHTFSEEIKANYPSVWEVLGKGVNDISAAVDEAISKGTGKKAYKANEAPKRKK